MLSGDRAVAREFGRTYGFFAVGFVLFVVLLALLSHLGLPDAAIGTLFGLIVLATSLIIGVAARTLRLREILFAGRAVPPAYNGLATAAAFLSSAGFLGLAGAFFAHGEAALAIVVGWLCGFALAAVLIAPYFRKSGAASVPDFLAIRFGGGLIRLAGVVAVVISLLPALAAAISAAGLAAGALFGASGWTAILIALAAILAATVFGGLRGTSRTAPALAIIFLIACLVPVAILSYRDYGLPIPQLGYGYALQDLAELAKDGVAGLGAGPASRLLPFPVATGFTLLALIVSVAAGTAALPHVLSQSAAASDMGSARRATAWALLFVVLVASAAPAYATFTRLALFDGLAGGNIDGLPDWVFAFGRLGLARICGIDATSVEALRAACPAAIAAGGPLAPKDVALGGDAVVLAFPAIAGLPPIMTALAAAGAFAAALAAASALLLAIGTAVGHDLYFKLFAPDASAGRRMIVTRLILILVAFLAAWLGLKAPGLMVRLAPGAFSLAASALFPALVLGIWWPGTTRLGALAGVGAGYVVAISVVGLGEWAGLHGLLGGVPSFGAAIFGLPVAILAIVGVSLARPLPAADPAILAAIRRPGPSPELEDLTN